MRQRFSWLAAAALLSACTPAPPASSPAPAGSMLAYSATSPVTVTYEFADSSAFNIQGGAIGDIRATIRGTGTAETTFAPKDSVVELRVRLTDFDGSFTNTAVGGTTSATESDVQGEAVLTVTPRGGLTVNQLPTLTRTAQIVGVSGNFFRRFIARLPGGRVQRGASWVDTVSSNEDNAGTRAAVRDIITATWARDTVVSGRTLNVITHTTERTLEITGTSEGVEIAQKLTGPASGYTLWDPQRNVIVERVETTDLSGTFDLPAMGITGLPVKATGSGRITLR